MVAYFFICHRKLWLFAKGLNLENVSGNVNVVKGRILHEDRFKRETSREIMLDAAKIDFLRFGDQVFVHEVKKSRKFEEAHIWQLKYYIYLLQKQGVKCSAGVIHYPATMRKVEVTLEEDEHYKMEQALQGIARITQEPFPPKRLNKRVCSRCAYFDFCYA